MNDSWRIWMMNNAINIKDGFEKEFVTSVLINIVEISSEDVYTQYKFKDSIGKNRRIDFVIKNSEKGYFLAIELDGSRRGNNETQAMWSDFLQRQNDLLEMVGPLLRFSNSQMFKDPNKVIKRIKKTLEEQLIQHIDHQEISSKYKIREHRLAELEAKLFSAEEEIKKVKINFDVNDKYSKLKSKIEILQREYYEQNESVKSAKSSLLLGERRRLEHALESSDKKLQAVTGENNLVIKTMLLITSIVVISMLVIISKTNTNVPTESDRYVESIYEQPSISNKNQSLLRVGSINTTNRIPAYKAAFYVGSSVMACGKLVEIKRFSNRIYLNLDKKFPSQSLTILIWKNNFHKFSRKFGDFETLKYRRLCAFGKIEEYKNNLQIKVGNENFLRLMQ